MHNHVFVGYQGKVNEMEILPPQPFNICTIMYTSGTSGDPKGVVLTHETIATFVSGVDLFLDQFEDKVNIVLDRLTLILHDMIWVLLFKYYLEWEEVYTMNQLFIISSQQTLFI